MDFVVVFNKETQDVTINGQKFEYLHNKLTIRKFNTVIERMIKIYRDKYEEVSRKDNRATKELTVVLRRDATQEDFVSAFGIDTWDLCH